MNVVLYALLRLIDLYSLVIFVYVLLSWIPQRRGFLYEVYYWLGKICDPYLDVFRKFIPPINGMLDISPIFAILVLQVITRVIYLVF